MKKAFKISVIVAGALLIANAVLMATIANLNIGLLPVVALGVMLLCYGILFEKLKAKRIVHIFVALVLSVVTVFGSFLAVYGNIDNASYTEKTVIVLGCGIRGERVSVGLAKRLNKAYEYYEKNPDTVIIVSGGQGPQEDIPEALAMKRYLVDKGIPEDKIIMEDKSTSTITNFKYSHEIMKEKGLPDDSVVFVTNAYHIYRGASYAKAEGLTVTHLGTDIIWYTIPMNYLREMLAVVKMWVLD
ncbi:MAG: YdcF family protein [Acutalibacteraceae bacterium]|nr:YdcF family protein [Acutalibacteraceae bacterium]